MCRTCRDGAPQLSLEPFSSATRQIVGAGRIIEADTIEGFIFRALGGETREEGSSITVTGPKKRYLRLAIYLSWKDAARWEGSSFRTNARTDSPPPPPPRRLEKLDPSAAR